MGILLKRFISDKRGTTAIEYGMIAACFSIAIISVLVTVATAVK